MLIMNDDNDICPACDVCLNKPEGVLRVKLNPDEVTKSVMLAGLTPDVIMDVLTRGLSFWVYQVNEQNLYLEAGLKTASENLTALGDYCEKNYVQYKKQTDRLNRKIQSLNEELEVNKKQCEDLIQQLQEKTKIINQLQLNKMKNSYSATNNTAQVKETSPNYFNQKLTPPQNAAFTADSFNEYRVPKQEPPTPIFSNLTQRESSSQNFPNFTQNFELETNRPEQPITPKLCTPNFSKTNKSNSSQNFANFTQNFELETNRPEQPITPKLFTPDSSKTNESNGYSIFSPKFEEPGAFPSFSPQNKQVKYIPFNASRFNRNGMKVHSKKEFNFQPKN
ncbi:uncharacterized protein LOC123306042 [Chrysoperla carnea]|uniref:uncharacterized protein LOC123306042 n=1 Tax=Chrysoperla carnea TaxID=189513 RepID=UPI001D09741F|nr:uncharacterized protein LOC123306042 [Chrysoperla carnea]